MSNYDNGFARAQAAYDAQTPDEGERRCECGHDYDDHADDPMTQDPSAFLEAVRHVDYLLERTNIGETRRAMDKAMTVCGVTNCTCRKFEPRTDDDYDDD